MEGQLDVWSAGGIEVARSGAEKADQLAVLSAGEGACCQVAG